MKKEKIIIGSRGSKLAFIYAQNVKNKILEISDLEERQVLIKAIVTEGDQVQNKRLSEVGGKGLFSKNIEKELLDDNIILQCMHLKICQLLKLKV